MRTIRLLPIALLLLAAPMLLAEDAPHTKPADPHAITFTGTIATGLMAIGGETTGTTISTTNHTFELDLQGDKELIKKAEALNGKLAVVTGTRVDKEGVEVKTRHIIKVKTLEAAAAEK